jgi:hypothetical protein
MDDWTTIAVRKNTHSELRKRGKKGECYDDVIRREIGMKPVEKQDAV